jgi:hypothetical protein
MCLGKKARQIYLNCMETEEYNLIDTLFLTQLFHFSSSIPIDVLSSLLKKDRDWGRVAVEVKYDKIFWRNNFIFLPFPQDFE